MADFEERKRIYKEYLLTPEWELLSGYARYRNKIQNNGILTCEECGKTTGQFDVHHWMYPNSRDYCNDDNPKYHIVLCHRCHGIIHNKIELSEKEKQDIDKKNNDNMIKLGLVFRIVWVDNPIITQEAANKLSIEELEKIIIDNNIPELS